MELLRKLRESFLSHWELYVALLGGTIAFLLHVLEVWHPRGETIFFIILGMLASLTISEIRKGLEQSGERSRLNEIEKGLSRGELMIARVAHAVSDKRVALRKRPSRQDDYVNLWGGFTGDYYVYNPSYSLEHLAGIKKNELVKSVFIERYRNPAFKNAFYLFLTGDEVGQNDLQVFKEMMELVRQSFPGVTGKIEVKKLAKNAVSDAEMYIGTKDGVDTAILELKDLALGQDRGIPLYYLIINDKEIISDLDKHFQKDWKNASSVDLWS